MWLVDFFNWIYSFFKSPEIEFHDINDDFDDHYEQLLQQSKTSNDALISYLSDLLREFYSLIMELKLIGGYSDHYEKKIIPKSELKKRLEQELLLVAGIGEILNGENKTNRASSDSFSFSDYNEVLRSEDIITVEQKMFLSSWGHDPIYIRQLKIFTSIW
ncbi:MAG TPA: hypothetical protein VJI68_03065 [Candidatus Nanoarchaeia archaeon]|nr:hypothetical protein [Candidatus Nanoarchaeia archaeon]